jgi:hypothetical protein
MFVCVFICCVGRGLCDGLITRPVEPYQVSAIDYETSRVRRPRFLQGLEPLMMMTTTSLCIRDL